MSKPPCYTKAMDDSEYYAMMRRQYSHTSDFKNSKPAKKPEPEKQGQTPGTFTEWSQKYGHEDAEMFYERNKDQE